jgi:hypothetical protein
LRGLNAAIKLNLIGLKKREKGKRILLARSRRSLKRL